MLTWSEGQPRLGNSDSLTFDNFGSSISAVLFLRSRNQWKLRGHWSVHVMMTSGSVQSCGMQVDAACIQPVSQEEMDRKEAFLRPCWEVFISSDVLSSCTGPKSGRPQRRMIIDHCQFLDRPQIVGIEDSWWKEGSQVILVAAAWISSDFAHARWRSHKKDTERHVRCYPEAETSHLSQRDVYSSKLISPRFSILY